MSKSKRGLKSKNTLILKKVVSVIRFRKTTKPCVFQALQAPACHENMVKVGGYILGEFGNLIAGDPRSR